MKPIGRWLSGAGYAAGWALVRSLPAPAVNTLFSFGADVAARRGGRGARQLRANLSRVVPQAEARELDELTRRAMRSYARYWQEVFRLPVMDRDAVSSQFGSGLSGTENLEAALAEGNGAIVALPHCGNWDIAGLWAARYAGTFTTVVERLRPESLFRRFVAFRESLGFEVLANDAGSGSFRQLLRRLRGNGIVCLVADREFSEAGVPVSFFGAQTRFPGGPARLAASTGAALLPVGCWFTDDGWGARIHPRIRVNAREEVPAATQALADVFAGDIAAHPADWHMLQPVWDESDRDSTSDAAWAG